MFKSELSGRQYPCGIKPVRVVVERRVAHYVNDEGKESEGWEIVKEITIGSDEVASMASPRE